MVSCNQLAVNRNFVKNSVLALRVALGWLFFYAGVTKIINPDWSAAGYLKSAKTLPDLFAWFALPSNIGWVNFLNEWGLTLVGIALILGIFTKWASLGGILLMVLYYLPILEFPIVGGHSFIIDEHIIYIIAFIIIIASNAGKYYGLDNKRN